MRRRTVRLPPLVAVLLLASACSLVQRNDRPVTGPIDVNTAAEADIQRLPGVTPSMAKRIYEGRPYATLDELVERGLLSEREFERVKKKIAVRAPQPAAP